MDKLQSTLKISSIRVPDTPLTNETPASDSDTFMINCYHSLGEQTQEHNPIYLDSGAGRTVINTFSLPVTVTHEGTLVFKGIHIHPVYYVPKGPVNLLSVSQLCDHGLKISTKSNMILVKQQEKVVEVFHREGNLFVMKLPVPTVYSVAITNHDRHLTLGHPNDNYMENMIKAGIISGTYTKSAYCEVCKKAKIKNRPHSAHLPQTKSPFFKLHLDTLQISPSNSKGHHYVLVIIDDFSRFNRIYCLTHKSQAESFIESYLNELKNKLNITPAFLHTDRGGEFSSKGFVDKLKEKGISFEQGPLNSPQTNGVAERFNQSLLSKMRCIIGQSNIPTSLWDEAANHASCLLNQLPHKFLNFTSPIDKVDEYNSRIEPKIDLTRILPFGMKVIVKNNTKPSKLDLPGEIMKALTFEKYSDSLRVLDPKTGRIKVTRDYTVPNHQISSIIRHPEETLPHESKLIIRLPKQSQPQDCSSSVQSNIVTNQESLTTTTAKSKDKHYEYVPYYEQPSNPVTSTINQENIIEGKRLRKPTDRLMLTDSVPYNQAIKDTSEKIEWKKAMDDEFKSLMTHNTGELVPYPDGNEKVIGGMWCLTRKRNEFGEVYRYKARWVVFGNHQEHLLHYFDTWASVGRNETLKTMLSLVVNLNLIAYQFDIETAFLHGSMDAIVYVKQVEGYEEVGKESWVWRLNKSLYGTKQAPRMWKAKLTEVLLSLSCISSKSDESLFITKNHTLMLHIHVDDGFLIGKSEEVILKFLEKLNLKLKLKIKKQPNQHLGYTLTWKKDMVLLNQSDLIEKLLKNNDMISCKPVQTPCNGNFLQEIKEKSEVINLTEYQKSIGLLNYLSQHTRPDIMFTVNQLSRYSTCPTSKHWIALKHLLRYLKGTMKLNLIYKKTKTTSIISELTGWADADYANAKEDRKSVSGYVIQVYENPVCWLSKKQSVVAQSTTEAEYISMNLCAKQIRWLTFVIKDLGQQIEKPTLFNDNSGAVIISKQASLNTNTKHIEVRYQYLRDCVLKKLLNVIQTSTTQMIADILTKLLGVQKINEALLQLHLEDHGGVSEN
ncbi:hypothetical protein O181_075272 [Austropuccinia psidii MF-1]|uniref:Integrase catalytic domain-containing protein n=1 Tax=Austropuccinia psidii MF-1 TaxID=1389203 RepID=A0A9Q3ICR3_9BASI|nr:hypothetical protein [Austropuccinia psidii MF-1]